jgi:hypothetical protein
VPQEAVEDRRNSEPITYLLAYNDVVVDASGVSADTDPEPVSLIDPESIRSKILSGNWRLLG